MLHSCAIWLRQADKFLILRGFAALSVVFYHTQDFTRSILKPFSLGDIRLDWLFMPDGPMAVRIFFALSGFLMFKAFYSHRYDLSLDGLKRFFRNRARRIAPLYYVIAFILLVFYTPSLLHVDHWKTLLSILLFCYNGDGPPYFVVPFWSLSTEVQFYLLMPLLYWLSRRFLRTSLSIGFATIAVIGGGILLRWLVWHYYSGAPGFSHQADFNYPLYLNLDSFLIGGLVCVWLSHRNTLQAPPATRRRWLIALCLLAASIFPLLSLYHFGPLHSDSYRFAGPTVAALLTAGYIWLSERIGTSGPRPGFYRLREVVLHPSRWPEFIGALSYGIYLWHGPVIEKLQVLIADTGWKDFLFKGSLAVLLATILAYITYRYVEAAARPASTPKP